VLTIFKKFIISGEPEKTEERMPYRARKPVKEPGCTRRPSDAEKPRRSEKAEELHGRAKEIPYRDDAQASSGTAKLTRGRIGKTELTFRVGQIFAKMMHGAAGIGGNLPGSEKQPEKNTGNGKNYTYPARYEAVLEPLHLWE